MYTLIDDVMSLADCEANATFYSITKNCWTTLSFESQKVWDLLLKQNKIKILYGGIKRTKRQANHSKQGSANLHEQEEDKFLKIKASVHNSRKAPTILTEHILFKKVMS